MCIGKLLVVCFSLFSAMNVLIFIAYIPTKINVVLFLNESCVSQQNATQDRAADNLMN